MSNENLKERIITFLMDEKPTFATSKELYWEHTNNGLEFLFVLLSMLAPLAMSSYGLHHSLTNPKRSHFGTIAKVEYRCDMKRSPFVFIYMFDVCSKSNKFLNYKLLMNHVRHCTFIASRDFNCEAIIRGEEEPPPSPSIFAP